jgi:3-hydroxyacyl-[acyl-carrier-protein] dehydratase
MIERLLPHRYPMLLVDRVLEWEAAKFIRAIKNVTVNEPFFHGHFPGNPVMPGVLVIESMAQVAGLLTMLSDAARQDGSQLVLFAGIDGARFKRQVVPGDTLLLEAELERAVRGIGRFRTRASVGDQLVCEATLLAAIRNAPPPPGLPAR